MPREFVYDYDPHTVPLFSGKVVLDHVGSRWRFKTPQTFHYSVMPDYNLYLEHLDMGLIATGHGWSRLYRNLDMELFRAWVEYALEQDCNLRGFELGYKKAMLENVEYRGVTDDNSQEA